MLLIKDMYLQKEGDTYYNVAQMTIGDRTLRKVRNFMKRNTYLEV